MTAAFEQTWVSAAPQQSEDRRHQDGSGPNRSWRISASFKKSSGVDRLVMIWCGSTELYTKAHPSMTIWKCSNRDSATIPPISPSMLYATPPQNGVPVRNGAPHSDGGCPSLTNYAIEHTFPSAARIFKSARLHEDPPGARPETEAARPEGWFSTNSWATATAKCWTTPRTQEQGMTKSSVLDRCIQPDIYRTLRRLLPQGEDRILSSARRCQGKAGTLDIFGWLGYPMQIKVTSSAATDPGRPMALDLVPIPGPAQRCPELAKMESRMALALTSRPASRRRPLPRA